MVFILSSPSSPPPAPVSPWFGLDMEWVGADGSVWQLTDWATGVFLDADALEGLHFPQIAPFSSESRAVPGRRLRGWRATARSVFWPVWIFADSSAEWLGRYRDFFNTVHPDRPGRWTVRADGSERHLDLTGVFRTSYAYSRDPLMAGWGKYGVTFEASQPYWSGKDVERGPWSTAAPVDFFESGGSPDFHIMPKATFGSATIDNPGDVDAYPVWTAIGPLSALELGVGGRIIDVPFSVSDGDVLVIDTDPRNQTATLDGVDVSETLGFQSFAPVPSGNEVPLHVEATGSGSVSCALTPLYFRAF